ncbi:MAG: hypothetical protein ACK56F_30990, partial [bacterium]
MGLGLDGRGHGQPHRRSGKPSGPDVQGHRAYRRRGAADTVPGRGRPDAGGHRGESHRHRASPR